MQLLKLFTLRRCVVILLGPIFLSLLASCGGGVDSPPKIVQVLVLKNGSLSDGLPLRFDALSTPRLADLAQREQLTNVVAGARNEFEVFLKLKEWTAKQFKHSIPNPSPPWDAMTILDWIRGGITGGFCAQYAQVYLQSLASLGFHGRYIEIGLNVNPYAHFVMEVWSNQYDKWIVMDVDYNMHFERRGVPMSALEVHDALLNNDLEEVDSVKGEFREGHDAPERWPLKLAELYYYLRFHLKANHLNKPDEAPFDRFNDMVEYIDGKAVPWEFSEVVSGYRGERLTKNQSSEPSYINKKMNQTEISINSFDSNKIKINLKSNMIEFAKYEYRQIDYLSRKSAWSFSASNSVELAPEHTTSKVEVRSVNVRGVPGPSAFIGIIFD